MDRSDWGPLGALAGSWAGDKGIDSSHSYAVGGTTENLYREEISFDPFGPVDNGTQRMFGLDYRMKSWRIDEDEHFHMEVGYWLWDAERHLVLRCFMVPRGVTVLAGGEAGPDATSFQLSAKMGEEIFGILQNPYLMEAARTVEYRFSGSIEGDTFSYEEDTIMEMRVEPGMYHHTDRNTLKKV
jgi:hypothetical protein